MRIALTGASGMLGSDLREVLEKDHEVLTTDVDVRDLEGVVETIHDMQPDLVIHSAAFTDVDGAESDRETAYQVNVLGTRNIAVASSNTGASWFTYQRTMFLMVKRTQGTLNLMNQTP